jgi:hypothetical protein
MIARAAAAALVASLLAPAVLGAAEGVLVDDFESVSDWRELPADGVEMKLSSAGVSRSRSMRFDVRYRRGGGYAVARKEVDLELPENYAFAMRIRGTIAPQNLELKLIDDSGDNVWWCNRRDYEFPKDWRTLVTRKRQITFAWGPRGGGEIRRVKAIEIAITAGSGGQGTVWLDDLELRSLPPPGQAVAPVARASSYLPGHFPALAVDTLAATLWEAREDDSHPWIVLDLRGERELGGVVIDWEKGRRSRRYVLEASQDGRRWTRLREMRSGGERLRDYLRLPETDARLLRLRLLDPAGSGRRAIESIRVMPLAWGATPESFFEAVARDARRGDYPRSLRGEQTYWTVVGVDGDTQEALMGEDGAIEVGKKGFSVEPFLFTEGQFWTWADVTAEASLEGGHLPIPRVVWSGAPVELEVIAFATGPREASSVVARYRLANRSGRRQRGTFYLALRPFQVNPPSQTLNTPGGTSPIHEMWREGRLVRVDGDRGVIALTEPSGFGVTAFDQGNIVESLRRDQLPGVQRVDDPVGFASGALAYPFELAPGTSRELSLLLPLHRIPLPLPVPPDPARWVSAELAKSRQEWERALGPLQISLPASAAGVTEDLRAQLAYVLVNRDRVAFQPGSRSYERSWIRDGALTGAALLRMGRPEVVRDFIEWFAPYQYDDGKVPCCVDHRGADPVPEHDSSGELIFVVAEYVRHTSDRGFARRMWPHVRRAAGYLDSLRQLRRTAAYRAPGKQEFFGLLPPSISHEGYSAKPMHSYWDDLFALRGFRDAAWLARALGLKAETARWGRVRDEFARDLRASVTAAMAKHRIDYVPGCADLGDFDATSTTIALDPVQAGAALPPAAVTATFERYWKNVVARRDGAEKWEALTPYEIRNVGAFVRLGWRERANQLLDWFRSMRRPPGFRHWAEVVSSDPRQVRFLGDMPHTWVGSDYIRAVLDMLAWERESDDALVVGAGVPRAWVEGEGLAVRSLSTRWGSLDLAMKRAGSGLEVGVGGDLKVPRGGIVLAPPGVTPRSRATVNGVRAPVTAAGQVVVRTLPARVQISP